MIIPCILLAIPVLGVICIFLSFGGVAKEIGKIKKIIEEGG